MTKIVVDKLFGFKGAEEIYLKNGIALLEKSINDPDFHAQFLKEKLRETNGMTNAQILSLLLSGADEMDGDEDHEINLSFSMYSKWWSKVIGYRYPGERIIHMNRKYFGDRTLIASNILHEYGGHMLGFDHTSARDWGSVPYRMNAVLEKYFALKGIED